MDLIILVIMCKVGKKGKANMFGLMVVILSEIGAVIR